MDLLQGVDIFKLGAVGIMAFGAVYVTMQFKSDMSAKQKMLAHFVFFLLFSFVPLDFANMIANKIRDAIAGTLLVAGFYQGSKDIAKSIK